MLGSRVMGWSTPRELSQPEWWDSTICGPRTAVIAELAGGGREGLGGLNRNTAAATAEPEGCEPEGLRSSCSASLE